MVEVVRTMSGLCGLREEVKRRREARPLVKSEPLVDPQLSHPETEVYPVRCHSRQCLFCLGKRNLADVDRQRVFTTKRKLSNHVEKHLYSCNWSEGVHCPHPACHELLLRNIAHFKNHALSTHGCELQASTDEMV